jgi:hypothetical protein
MATQLPLKVLYLPLGMLYCRPKQIIMYTLKAAKQLELATPWVTAGAYKRLFPKKLTQLG